MTRRPLLLLAAILLALLIAAFVLWLWVGILRSLAGASTPVGQNAARTTPSTASRALARPVLPASPDPAADQPAARAAQGPSVVAGEGATLGPSAQASGQYETSNKTTPGIRASYLALRTRISWCESRNQPTVVNKTSGAAGLFQFMPDTFRAVTGLKPPASAYSVAVQTAAFDALYKLRGTSPWNSSKGCWAK